MYFEKNWQKNLRCMLKLFRALLIFLVIYFYCSYSTEDVGWRCADPLTDNNPQNALMDSLEAVSYEEYFRQIFGLSGSKKIVENIPRKYYLGNMGSVLRFRNIFFCFWWRDVKAFRWGFTGGADDNITQQIPTYAGDAECCCAAVHTARGAQRVHRTYSSKQHSSTQQ